MIFSRELLALSSPQQAFVGVFGGEGKRVFNQALDVRPDLSKEVLAVTAPTDEKVANELLKTPEGTPFLAYKKEIEAASKKENIPQAVLIQLFIKEASGGDPKKPNAAGSKAVGLGQVMPSTWTDLIKGENPPYPALAKDASPAQQINMTAKYLRQMKDGKPNLDWGDAMVYYNTGPGGVDAQSAITNSKKNKFLGMPDRPTPEEYMKFAKIYYTTHLSASSDGKTLLAYNGNDLSQVLSLAGTPVSTQEIPRGYNILATATERTVADKRLELANDNAKKDLARILDNIGQIKLPLEINTDTQEDKIPDDTLQALKNLDAAKQNPNTAGLFTGKIILNIPPTERRDHSVKESEIQAIIDEYNDTNITAAINALFEPAINHNTSDPRIKKFKKIHLQELIDELGSSALPNPFGDKQYTALRKKITDLWEKSQNGKKLELVAGEIDPLAEQGKKRLQKALKDAHVTNLSTGDFDIHLNDKISSDHSVVEGSHIAFFPLTDPKLEDALYGKGNNQREALEALETVLKFPQFAGTKIDDNGTIVAPKLTTLDASRVQLQAVIKKLFSRGFLSLGVLQSSQFQNFHQKGVFDQYKESNDNLISAENLKLFASWANKSGKQGEIDTKEKLQAVAQKMLSFLNVNGTLKDEWKNAVDGYDRYLDDVRNIQRIQGNEKDSDQNKIKALLAILETKKASLDSNNAQDQKFLKQIEMIQAVFRDSETLVVRRTATKTNLKLEEDKLGMELSGVDNRLKQTITAAQTEIINARLTQQAGVAGWAVGNVKEWHATHKLESMQNAGDLNTQAIRLVQEYAVYIAQKESQNAGAPPIAASILGNIQLLKKQRSEESDPEKQKKLDADIDQQKLYLAEYGRALGLVSKKPGEALVPADADNITAANLTDIAAAPLRLYDNHDTQDFVRELFAKYKGLSSDIVPLSDTIAPLTEAQFTAIFRSTYHIAIARSSLELEECKQAHQKTGGIETIAGLIADISSAKNKGEYQTIDLEQAKIAQITGNDANMFAVTKLLSEGKNESETTRALEIVQELTKNLTQHNKPYDEGAAAKAYHDALNGQGWCTNNLSGTSKLVLLFALAAAALKHTDGAVIATLAIGAGMLATGAKDPFDALSKLAPPASEAAKKVLAKFGWFDRGEWQRTAESYNVKLEEDDILAFNRLKNVDMEHILQALGKGERSVSEDTLQQLGKERGKPYCQPSLLSLMMKINGTDESLGLTEIALEKALKKILIMRGGAEKTGNSSSYLSDGYAYTYTDIFGGPVETKAADGTVTKKTVIGTRHQTFFDWSYAKVKVIDDVNKWGTLAQWIGIGEDAIGNVGHWLKEAGENTIHFGGKMWAKLKGGTFDALSTTDKNGKPVWFFTVNEGPNSGNYFIDAAGNLRQAGANFMDTKVGKIIKGGIYAIEGALNYLGVSNEGWMPKEKFSFGDDKEKQEQFDSLVGKVDTSFYPLYHAVEYAEEDFGTWIPPIDAPIRGLWKNIRTGNGGAFEDNRAQGQILSARTATIQEIYRKLKANKKPKDIEKEVITDAQKNILNVISQIVDQSQSNGTDVKDWFKKYEDARMLDNESAMYDLIEEFENHWWHSSFLFGFRNISKPEENARIFAQINNIGVPKEIQGKIDGEGNLVAEGGDIHKFEKKLLAAYRSGKIKPKFDSSTITVDPWGQNWSKGGGELFGQTMFLYKEFLSTAINPNTGKTETDYDKYKEYLEMEVRTALEKATPFERKTITDLRSSLQYYPQFTANLTPKPIEEKQAVAMAAITTAGITSNPKEMGSYREYATKAGEAIKLITESQTALTESLTETQAEKTAITKSIENQALANADTKVKALKEQRDGIKDEFAGINADINKLEEGVITMKGKKNQLQPTDIAEADKIIADLEKQIAILSTARDAAKRQIDELSAFLIETEKDANPKIVVALDTKQVVSKKGVNIAVLKQQINETDQSFNIFKGTIDTAVEAAIKYKRGGFQTLLAASAGKKVLDTHIAYLKTLRSELDDKITAFDTAIDAVNTPKKTPPAKVQQVEDEKQSGKEKIEKYKKWKEKLNTDIGGLEKFEVKVEENLLYKVTANILADTPDPVAALAAYDKVPTDKKEQLTKNLNTIVKNYFNTPEIVQKFVKTQEGRELLLLLITGTKLNDMVATGTYIINFQGNAKLQATLNSKFIFADFVQVFNTKFPEKTYPKLYPSPNWHTSNVEWGSYLLDRKPLNFRK